MRATLVLAAVLLAAGCAGTESLLPGRSSAAELRAAMGAPALERRQPNGETWLYYPNQPFGRKVLVARVAGDGRLLALEQRLSEEYLAKLVPNQSRKEDVLDLFGPPYDSLTFPRLERETWSWHMRQFGHLPAGLHVQMSADGVVREVYVLDETVSDDRRDVR
ncbi:MAG TPA: hypothetical protein VG591_08880 [Burkholderiales bacterium]|nr:hypothetical protein [Burkholderiales bacterium]